MIREARFKYGVAVIVALITFMVYIPALRNGFVNWDDDDYVYKNSFIHPVDAVFVKWAFFDFYSANWHPLTWISHALDYAIWGLNPLGHHLTNNILHAINTFLVVLLVAKLLETVVYRQPSSSRVVEWSSGTTQLLNYSTSSRFTLIAAATTGLLFGLHPLHVESVAWVSERKDLLCAMFYLLSVMTYVRYAADASHEPRGKGHGAKGRMQGAERKGERAVSSMRYALCFFILALLSKPMAVSLPFVLLILDWYPLGRLRSMKGSIHVIAEKIPFFILSLLASIIAILSQSSGSAVITLSSISLPARFAVSTGSVMAYLRKMILPVNLLPFYPYPGNVSLLQPQYYLPILCTVLISVICIAASRRKRIWLTVWGCYLLTLLPVLGIVQVGYQSMADRYTYLPSIGPFVIAGLAAAWLNRKFSTTTLRSAGGAVVLLLFGLLAYATVLQISIWRDSFTLWNYEMQKRPEGVAVAYYHRANAYFDSNEYDKAITDHTQAIALKPDYFEAYSNRAAAYNRKGLYDKAVDDYTSALSLDANFRIYVSRGHLYLSKGLSSEAEEDFRKAIELNAKYDEGYNGLGMVYYMNTHYEKAYENFSRAISLNPRNASSFVNRGYVQLRKNENSLASTDFLEACRLGNQNGCKAVQQHPAF